MYIGAIAPDGTRTIAANPFLKLIFGLAPDVADESVRPFEPESFGDEAARKLLIDASVYAATKLTEVESRAHYVRDLHRSE